MNTLQEIVNDYKKENKLKEKLLSFCHTTDMRTLKGFLIPSLKLKAVGECEYENKEKLIFLFYGKASYYPLKGQKDGYNNTNLPITLIYDDSILATKINRLYCFDSGGYFYGFYNLEGDKPTQELLKKFSIELPKRDDIIAGIEALYKSNDNYMKGKFTPHYLPEDKPLNFCLDILNSISKSRKNIATNFGPQANTFEIQIEGCLDKLPIAASIPLSECTSESAKDHWKEYFPDSKLIIYDFDTDEEKYTLQMAYSNMRESVKEFNKELITE
jgi:hypothetical protein